MVQEFVDIGVVQGYKGAVEVLGYTCAGVVQVSIGGCVLHACTVAGIEKCYTVQYRVSRVQK